MTSFVRFTIRLVPGRDDDLIQWLASLEFWEKNRRAKEALRRGLGAAPGPVPSPVAADLAEIRSVVEAAVESALARWEGMVRVQAAQESDPEETERLLDGLGEALML